MEKDEERGEGGGASQASSKMRQRRVTLADGRYLIFYTFEQGAQTSEGSKPEPTPQNVAEEERRV